MAASSPSPSERRGIPGASFVGDVQTYLTESGLDVNSSLAFLQERLQQYKIVEMKLLLAQQRDLQAKIPDIEKCLDVVATLQGKKGTGESRAKRINWDPQCRAGDLPERFMAAARSCRMGDLLHTPLPNTALVADFEVSEGIYSQTRIEGTDSVSLWLGANVMLEYSLEEAETLLRKNLENAKASLEVLVADLQFLRDQVTITQVTTARVYNWDVHQRRSKQAA